MLAEELDKLFTYKEQLADSGLTLLNSRLLAKFPVYQDLLQRLSKFTDEYNKQKELWKQRTQQNNYTESLSEEELSQRCRLEKKKQTYEALKGLMIKLTHLPETEILGKQIDQVKSWFERKLHSEVPLNQLRDLEHKRKVKEAQMLATDAMIANRAALNMPSDKCACGQEHPSHMQVNIGGLLDPGTNMLDPVKLQR